MHAVQLLKISQVQIKLNEKSLIILIININMKKNCVMELPEDFS